jgi:prepilin-type N-terminal cleavage/methylation domain-containing protein
MILYKHTKKGFTLIELLVVIAIIGLLSSISVYAINVARLKARDSKRAQAVRQITTALELYFDDNGFYPGTTSWVSDCGGNNAWENVIGTALEPYIKDIPHDSLFPNNPWPLCFYYKLGDYGSCSGTGHSYTLLFTTESTIYDFKKYNNQGEGGTAARYCIHPD